MPRTSTWYFSRRSSRRLRCIASTVSMLMMPRATPRWFVTITASYPISPAVRNASANSGNSSKSSQRSTYPGPGGAAVHRVKYPGARSTHGDEFSKGGKPAGSASLPRRGPMRTGQARRLPRRRTGPAAGWPGKIGPVTLAAIGRRSYLGTDNSTRQSKKKAARLRRQGSRRAR